MKLLLLPGQGILTIAMGLVTADFPGKRRIERWLVARPGILKSLNWVRARAGRPLLIAPGQVGPGQVEPDERVD